MEPGAPGSVASVRFTRLVRVRKGQPMSDWKLIRAMRWSVGIVVASGLLVSLPAKAGGDTPFVYPKAKKVEQVDDYHGTKVADPYRGLEDPDTPESKAW